MKTFFKTYFRQFRFSQQINLLLFSIPFIFLSCEKEKDNSTGNLSGYSIYTVGQYYDNGWKGCYWKNLERTDLNGDLTSITVNDIFLSDGNVYVSGHYNRGSLVEIPCYWKNTERIDLAGGSEYQAYTCAIYVENGIVYTAGRYYNGIKNIPCYWVNTTRTDIIDYPNSTAEITDIKVKNGDVYLSGKYSVPSSFGPDDYKACYWKNGVIYDISTNNSISTSIFIADDNVYLGGGYNPVNAGSSYNLCYWKNGVKSDINTSGNITDMFVSSDIVYTSGDDGDKPCFWKGNKKTVLSGIYRANSIFVKNDEVFTTGYYINEKDSRRPHVPCFWINNQRYDLPVTGDPLDSKANNAFSIFVE
jgi:hypothetical protein